MEDEEHPTPCYCGTQHCGACGVELNADTNPPYANPYSFFDERWICKTCAEAFSEASRW